MKLRCGRSAGMLVVGVIGLVTVSAAEEPPVGLPRQGLQGSIEAERTHYQVGEPITVTVVLTNVSRAPVMIDAWPGNWFVQVFDESWEALTPIAMVDVFRPSVTPTILKPGESWKTTIRNFSLTTGLPGSTPNWEYPPLKSGTYWLGALYGAPAYSQYPDMWSGGLNCQYIQITVGHDIGEPEQDVASKPGEPVNSLQLTVTTSFDSPPSWVIGEPYQFQAQLKNVGDQPLLLDLFGDLNERFTVEPERSVAFEHWLLTFEKDIKTGRPMLGPPVLFRGLRKVSEEQFVSLKPGESFIKALTYTLQSFSRGRFSVTVTYRSWGHQNTHGEKTWNGAVISNPIVLTVVDGREGSWRRLETVRCAVC